MGNLKKYVLLFLVYTMTGFPMLYYTYKYGGPQFGEKDVFSYYKLYENWDFSKVDAPFNQRLLSTASIHVLYKLGVHYDTETAIVALKLSPAVYFSALVFNFLCVIFTCLLLYRMLGYHLGSSPLLSFSGGLLFLLGFGTIFFLISALTDALSVLLVALLFDLYLRKSVWQFPVLLLAVFQREYVFFIFGLLAVLDWCWEKESRKYFLTVLAANIFCFLVYFVLRKTIFFTERYNYQVSVSHLLRNFADNVRDLKPYLKQVFLTQNLIILYAGVLIYKIFGKMNWDRRAALRISALFFQVVLIGFMVVLGNNTGRIFYMVSPIVIFYLIKESMPILASVNSGSINGQ